MNVNFEKLKISNYSVIESAEIDLSVPGLTLIEGKVLQDKSQASKGYLGALPSNGAGKSSLAEAFYFCLTGNFFDQNSTLCSVVNRFSMKPLMVEITGKKNDESFRICRSVICNKKTAKPQHKVELFVDNVPFHKLQVSNADIQSVINEYLGITPILLLNSRIYGQGEISSFSNVNDRQKKEIIDSMAGIGICEKILRLLKQELTSINTKYIEYSIKEKSITTTIESLKSEIAQLNEREKAWKEENDIEKQRKQLESRIRDIMTILNELNYIDIAKQREALVATVNQLKQLWDRTEEKRKDIMKISNSTTENRHKLETEIMRLELNLNSKKKEKESLVKKVSDIVKNMKDKNYFCPLCGQPWHQEGLTKHIKELIEKVKALENEIDQIESTSLPGIRKEMEYVEDRIKQVKKEGCEIEQTIANVSNEYKQKLESIRNFDQILSKVNGYLNEKSELEKKISNLTVLESPFADIIQDKMQQLETNISELHTLSCDIDALKDDLKHYEFLVQAFDRNGIPLLVTRDAIKVINSYLSYYKSKLLQHDFELFYSIETKRGGEEIVLNVVNPNGGIGYGRQSKGEKLRINLCQMFALARFAETQNKCRLNVKWFDEVFSELDSKGCDALVNLIKEDPCPLKFIITHKETLADEFDSIITVTKIGHVSNVTQQRLG